MLLQGMGFAWNPVGIKAFNSVVSACVYAYCVLPREK